MKISALVLVGALVVAVAGTALAGYKTGQAVYLSTTSRFANGDLGYVRNTADTSQYIGCEVYSYTNQTYAYCFARDAAGTYAGCSTTNANLITAVASLKSDGYLYFQWDTTSTCTFVEQQTTSDTAPKSL